MKNLNNILEQMKINTARQKDEPKKVFVDNTTVSPKNTLHAPTQGSQDFIDLHTKEETPDANGNTDDVFKAANIKTNDRKKSRHGHDAKDSEGVNEMSKAEMSKREDIVKGMKKSLSSFKDRYGKDAESVMYATATKMAMKEETEELDEGADAQKRFSEYHNQIGSLMKGIHQSLEMHKKLHGANTHWGHVGDVARIHDSLRDIHDMLAERGEYAKTVVSHQKKMDQVSKMMKEDVDVEEQKFDSMLDAVGAHKQEQHMAEAYATLIEQLFGEAETDEEREAIVEMVESEEAFEQFIQAIDELLAEEYEEVQQ